MPTQLEVFEDRLNRIAKWTSDKTVAAETYYNDMLIMMSLLDAIEEQVSNANCPLCGAPGPAAIVEHETDCPLQVLYRQYKGITYKLPLPREAVEKAKAKGAWEEPDYGVPNEQSQANPVPVQQSPGFNGYTRSGGNKPAQPRNQKPPAPPFKIWEMGMLGVMEFKGSREVADSMRARYEKSGWKLEEEEALPNGEVSLTMTCPRSMVRDFIEEMKAENQAARALLESSGGI